MPEKLQQPDRSGKQNSREITPAVAAISELEFQGVVIPHSWWITPHLRYDSGRSNVVAALVLADICYWYRATETRNGNGEVVARQRKFRSDKLQKSYNEWAKQFGITKRQVQNAVAFLVDRGLITRETRTFEMAGRKLGNVTFFEPVVDAIAALTFDTLSLPKVIPLTSCGDTSHFQKREVSRSNVIPLTFKGETNTEITHETTPENTQREGSVCVAAATPAGADTHTLSPAPSAKKKSGKNPVAEVFPRLTEKQAVVYKILSTYFPSLGTPANRVEFARFLQEDRFSPYGAALMCAWLRSNERNFPFMRMALFRQLIDEFSAQHEEDLKVARYCCHSPVSEKMKTIKALWSEWEAREETAKKKGAAK